MNKAAIYSQFDPRETANMWYRLEVPIQGLRNMGFAISHIESRSKTGAKGVGFPFLEADVVWVHHTFDLDLERLRETLEWASTHPWPLAGALPKPNRGLVVYDIDDDMFAFEPGAAGSEDLVISDGKGNPVTQRRRERILSQHLKNIEWADAIVCSTPILADVIKARFPEKRVHVFPNLVTASALRRTEHPKTDRVRILWQGGQNHHRSLDEILPGLRCLDSKYGNLEIVLWGVNADPIAFPDGWTIISPVPFSEFFDKLNSFGHDIALAPLARNVLNQSRSANKFYESAICSKPAACVASRYGAFQAEIEHGVSGMLYSNIDEFVENMSRLIEDRAFREKIADNGRKRCWARLDPDQHIRELAEAVRHWLTPGSG